MLHFFVILKIIYLNRKRKDFDACMSYRIFTIIILNNLYGRSFQVISKFAFLIMHINLIFPIIL